MTRRCADARTSTSLRSYLCWLQFTTATMASITGTSIGTPTTVASAAPDWNPLHHRRILAYLFANRRANRMEVLVHDKPNATQLPNDPRLGLSNGCVSRKSVTPQGPPVIESWARDALKLATVPSICHLRSSTASIAET